MAKRCRIRWIKGKFGYDVIKLNSRGRSVNKINYGLPRAPTKAQKAEARRRLCGGAS